MQYLIQYQRVGYIFLAERSLRRKKLQRSYELQHSNFRDFLSTRVSALVVSFCAPLLRVKLCLAIPGAAFVIVVCGIFLGHEIFPHL